MHYFNLLRNKHTRGKVKPAEHYLNFLLFDALIWHSQNHQFAAESVGRCCPKYRQVKMVGNPLGVGTGCLRAAGVRFFGSCQANRVMVGKGRQRGRGEVAMEK